MRIDRFRTGVLIFSFALGTSALAQTGCGASGLCINFGTSETQFQGIDFPCNPSGRCNEVRSRSLGTTVTWYAQNAANDLAAPTSNGNRLSLVDGGREGGGKAIKLTTLDNDCCVHSSGASERSEIQLDAAKTAAAQDGVQWWAHSVYLPADSALPPLSGVGNGIAFMQFHEGASSPDVLFDFFNQGGTDPHRVIRAFVSGAGTVEPSQFRYRARGSQAIAGQCIHDSVETGGWYDFVHRITWSATGKTGSIETWMRPPGGPVKKVLHQTGIHTLYARTSHPSLKLGAYHAPVVGANTSVIHDRIRSSSLSGAAGADAVRLTGKLLDFPVDLNATVVPCPSTTEVWKPNR